MIKRMRAWTVRWAVVMLTLFAGTAMAQSLTQEEIDLLGDELTPVGAEKAGNAAGTIPDWTGGLSPDAGDLLDNNFLSNPFAGAQPLFTLTAQNYHEHRAHLTPGQIALFERYPETYRMDIYESQRSVGYPPDVYEQIKKTAGQARLVNGGDGIDNFSHGAVAFPIPKSGVEVVWNHHTRYRINYDRSFVQAVSRANGAHSLIRLEESVAYPQFMRNVDASSMPNILFFYRQRVTAPSRLAGNVLLVHDTLDQLKEPRMAWIYNAGQRRVRRAPQVAYDSPGTGSDGSTSDNFAMYNGAPDRYDWRLIGKKEVYVPYNGNRLTDQDVKYEDILQTGHLNPDLTRYELHRVWEVQGTLKSNQRHIYAQRNFFVDEDSWMITLADHYDGRATLWRVGEGHVNFNFKRKTPGYSVVALYDLLAGDYVATGLYSEEESGPDYDYHPGYSDFTPAALRASGVR